jgi:hypothetical protein
VEDQELLRLRRLQGLPLVALEPPSPPLWRILNQQGSFEATGPRETLPEPAPRGDYSTPKEPTISDLGAEALGLVNPSITDFSTPILVQVVPFKETPSERQLVLQETMEENAATLSKSHTLILSTTT